MTRSILLLCSFLLCTASSPAAPVRPADDGFVLATVPAGLAAGSQFRLAEQALAAEPGNRAVAVRFARLAIEEGRTRADPRFLGRAEAALSPWFAEPDPGPDLRVLRAVVAQAAHRFADATHDLDTVLAERPDDPEARLVRAGVRIVTGDLAGAAEDCSALRPVGGVLPAVVCRARIGALSGHAEAAVAAIGRAMALSPEGPQSRFAALVAAEAAAIAGRPKDALAILDEAAADARDVPLLVTRAELLLDLGRPSEVLAALDSAGGAEVILLARARAAVATGDKRLAGWVADLEERFATARAVANSVHLREEARFELSVRGDPAAALVLAAENWRVQKEPADARLLLEAAVAAGDPEAARPVVDHIRTTGLADARLAPLVARIEGSTP